ncbi:MAG: radical SAM protein [Ignavibacteriales bacterium]|nr:radical SAM protein [Ignavibacteriales bacterium]
MNNILLTHSYFYRFDPKQWETKKPYPPLGTLYAASYLRSNGFDVSVFDTNLAESATDIIPVLEKNHPKYLIIYDDGFNYLTKMCLTKMRESAFQLSQIGKQFGCTVIVSGSDSTDHYEKYLDHGADYILMGEGEVTLYELLTSIESGNKNIEKINGIALRSGTKTITTGKRQILTALDEFPFPAWDLIDIDKYRKIWLDNHGYFSLNIATTRGCPFKCNWCAKPIYGTRYNSRSPKNVSDEIEFLIKEYQPDHFWFCDDIFGLKPGWINEFRNIVLERNMKFKYKIQSRVDLLLNENNIDALFQSGAETVWVGAESGSQRILDAMDKGTTIGQIYSATKLLKEKKINVAFFIQLGYLSETKKDIEKTIEMITELLPDDIGISVSYPLPGTKFYEMVKADLGTKTNWNDSDDLAMMFRNTFQPVYYKRMHHFIHRVYRNRKAISALKAIINNPFRQKISTLKTALSIFYYLPQVIIDSFYLKRLEGSN